MGRTALSIKHAGSIEHDVRNRSWRVKIELNRKTHTGPRRSSKAEAKSDQAECRRSASRQAFAEVLRQLTFTAGNQTSRSSAPQLASLKPKKMSSKPAVQPNSLRCFVLKRQYIDLILTGLKTLEIRCRRYRPGPAYIGTSTPPLVYATLVTGEPFQITTLQHWRALQEKHRAVDFKGRDTLPYKKTKTTGTWALPILDVHRLKTPLRYKWRQGCVGMATILPSTTSD
jgi:hypothetical protein